MACNRCMNEYIKQARLTAQNPARAPSVVWFLRKAQLHATAEERRDIERAIKDYQRTKVMPEIELRA